MHEAGVTYTCFMQRGNESVRLPPPSMNSLRISHTYFHDIHRERYLFFVIMHLLVRVVFRCICVCVCVCERFTHNTAGRSTVGSSTWATTHFSPPSLILMYKLLFCLSTYMFRGKPLPTIPQGSAAVSHVGDDTLLRLSRYIHICVCVCVCMYVYIYEHALEFNPSP